MTFEALLPVLRRRLLLLPVLAILAVPSAANAAEGQAAEGFGARQAVLETPWFTFYSHFGFNLYDAVLTSATERRARRADPLHEGSCFGSLVQEERSAWDAAVAYYAETVAATNDFSRERSIVRAHLTGIEIGDLNDGDRRDLGLSLLFLQAAAPAWRACRWEEQDAANRRWAAELGPRLERHADAVGGRLEKLFGVAWRRRPIAVDVVATAGWSGADTIVFRGGTTHTQISSRNPEYQGPAALEMIFHEASHELVGPHNGPIAELIAATSRETGVEVHRNLWHGLLFVTVGEVVREALAAAGEGPYKPFADDVFGGGWAVLRQPLVEQWLPFVRGETGREEAARRLLTALGKACGGPREAREADLASIQAFVAGRKMTVLTFAGYSGAQYQDPAAMLESASRILDGQDPAKTLINIGATAVGIGAVYDLAKRKGFTTLGIVSSLARDEKVPLSNCVDYVFYVPDSTWGGMVSGTDRLSPTSTALVEASTSFVAIGGGDVARDEMLAARRAGKPVTFIPADMNHEIARERARKRGEAEPTDFRGSAHAALATGN